MVVPGNYSFSRVLINKGTITYYNIKSVYMLSSRNDE